MEGNEPSTAVVRLGVGFVPKSTRAVELSHFHYLFKMRLPFLKENCSCSTEKKKSKTLKELLEQVEIQRAKLKLEVEKRETELYLNKIEGKKEVTHITNEANTKLKTYDSISDIEAAKKDVMEELRTEGKTGWDRFMDTPIAQAIFAKFSENLNTRVNSSVNSEESKKKGAITVKENYFG